jgi:hypothetical protein
MSYDSLQVYGIGITTANARLNNLVIQTGNTRMQGIVIDAQNQFNGVITVTDQSGNALSGATVNIVSTQTHADNYVGNLSGTTDSQGAFIASGSSTTGTTVTVSKSGYHTYIGPLTSTTLDSPPGMGISLKEQVIQRVKVTNRGNIMINPNDGILIELD